MKSLVILDRGTDLDRLARISAHAGEIDIFPLTSNVRFIEAAVAAASAAGNPTVRVLNNVQAIDREVSKLRTVIREWSAQIAGFRIEGESVRERLLLGRHPVSSWWFGLIAEKNNLKTDVFLRLAQVNAIRETIAAERYTKCVIGLSHRGARKSIERICLRFRVAVALLPVSSSPSILAGVKRFIRNAGLAGEAFSAVIAWARFWRHAWIARRMMGARGNVKGGEAYTLFATYFPAFDENAARAGTFRNNYGPALQELLQRDGRRIAWLLLYVNLNGMSFRAAAAQARLFADGGATIFFVEQFIRVRDFCAALVLWIRQGLIAGRVYRAIDRAVLLPESIGADSEPLVKDLWNASFWGAPAVLAILYYFAFRAMFREAGPLTNCLYYWEMHAWETALLAARNVERPQVRAIGVQHTSVPRNYWPYFPSITEIQTQGRPGDRLLPEIVAVGGARQRDILAECGYTGLIQVEAARYLYLNSAMRLRPRRSQAPLLVVAGSIDRTECLALLALVAAAFPRADTWEVWLRAHPCQPFLPLLAELDIDIAAAKYRISDGDIHDCLGAAWAVLVPASTVALEALAFGCDVIAPSFADSMQMNPLADFDGWCRRVASPDELRRTMETLRASGAPRDPEPGRRFIRSYWNLDETLPEWSSLLGLKAKSLNDTPASRVSKPG